MSEFHCPRCQPEEFKKAAISLSEFPEGSCSTVTCDFRVCSTYYCWSQLDVFIFVKYNTHFQRQTEIYIDLNHSPRTEKLLTVEECFLDPTVSDDELKIWLAFL